MSDTDIGLIILLLFAVAAIFLFPGGPGTPLQMRVKERPSHC
jgi:hypothetical protein